jgi:hypothetical protein
LASTCWMAPSTRTLCRAALYLSNSTWTRTTNTCSLFGADVCPGLCIDSTLCCLVLAVHRQCQCEVGHRLLGPVIPDVAYMRAAKKIQQKPACSTSCSDVQCCCCTALTFPTLGSRCLGSDLSPYASSCSLILQSAHNVCGERSCCPECARPETLMTLPYHQSIDFVPPVSGDSCCVWLS